MNSKLWIQKALSMCLVVAIVATYSMVALASSEKAAGELLVTGKSINGETPFVTVNGETAKTGRSVFSSSTIATPENASAIINLGKTGRIELAPNTTFTVNFNEKGITGSLASGMITVLGASNNVGVKMADGNTVELTAGESATANGKTDDKDDKKADNKGGAAWWIWAAIFGGAAVGVIYAATSNNGLQLGGTATVASPNR
jgi:hypothetical protein